MRQTAIGFYSKKLELEGVLSTPSDGGAYEAAAVAVCHSHPVLGGDMNDSLVTAVCQAADQQRMVTLRFNFRGVGGSQGEFTNGKEEHHDARAAIDVLRSWPGVGRKRVGIVGYSAGATILLDGFRRLRGASAFVLVAPTLAALRSSRFLNDKRPRLVIAASEDRVAPSLEIQRLLDGGHGPVRFHDVAGADHSMRGHQQEVGEVAAEFLIQHL